MYTYVKIHRILYQKGQYYCSLTEIEENQQVESVHGERLNIQSNSGQIIHDSKNSDLYPCNNQPGEAEPQLVVTTWLVTPSLPAFCPHFHLWTNQSRPTNHVGGPAFN